MRTDSLEMNAGASFSGLNLELVDDLSALSDRSPGNTIFLRGVGIMVLTENGWDYAVGTGLGRPAMLSSNKLASSLSKIYTASKTLEVSEVILTNPSATDANVTIYLASGDPSAEDLIFNKANLEAGQSVVFSMNTLLLAGESLYAKDSAGVSTLIATGRFITAKSGRLSKSLLAPVASTINTDGDTILREILLCNTTDVEQTINIAFQTSSSLPFMTAVPIAVGETIIADLQTYLPVGSSIVSSASGPVSMLVSYQKP